MAFFSVNVYPSIPKTNEDMARFVVEEDLMVDFCCSHILDSMQKSTLDSFGTLSSPERVSSSQCN